MLNVVFLVLGILQFIVASIGTRDVRRNFSWYAVLVLIVVFGLAYDNVAIAAGAVWGEGDLLKTLNAPRYWVHALFTPAMMIVAFGALRLAGVGWAQSRLWHTVVCVLATVLILLGSYIDILNLTLVPETENGVLRYVNDFHLFKGPPIPAVVTILMVLIFGAVLWRKIKWPWLFLGSLVMFLAAAATGFPIIQNVGEIAFGAGLVFTMIRVQGGARVSRPALAQARAA